jgi:hypothetical protein
MRTTPRCIAPAIFVAIFLNEFHCSGVISFEAIGVEVDAKFPEMS